MNGLPYIFFAKNKVKPKGNLNIFGFGLMSPIYILLLFLNVWEHCGSSILFLDRMFLCVLYSWKPLNVSTWEVLINLQKCHICVDVILHVTNAKNTKQSPRLKKAIHIKTTWSFTPIFSDFLSGPCHSLRFHLSFPNKSSTIFYSFHTHWF